MFFSCSQLTAPPFMLMLIDIYSSFCSPCVSLSIPAEKVPPNLLRLQEEVNQLEEKACQAKMEMSLRGYRMQLRMSWEEYQEWEDWRGDSLTDLEEEYSSSKGPTNKILLLLYLDISRVTSIFLRCLLLSIFIPDISSSNLVFLSLTTSY